MAITVAGPQRQRLRRGSREELIVKCEEMLRVLPLDHEPRRVVRKHL